MLMSNDPLAGSSLEDAIRLRWVLRDIRSKRLTLLPASEKDLDLLTQMGLIESTEGGFELTQSGRNAI
jgi:hypothetical protein